MESRVVILYEYTRYPKKEKSLFITTGEKHEVARVGSGDMLAQFSDYTIAYFYTAIALIEKYADEYEEKEEYIHHSNEYKEEILQHKLDECAMPVCFLFRQYLELTLKDIYIQYSLAPPDELQKMINDVGHDLKKTWDYAKPIIETVLRSEDRDYFDGLESYVIQFHNNDQSSMKYRYPIDKKLKLYSEDKKLNLFNLKKRMEEIEYFLSTCILSHLDIEKIKNISKNGRNAALKFWGENKLPEAIACYLEVLKNSKKMFGENHYNYFVENFEIGLIYLQNKQLKESHDCFMKSLDVYAQIKNTEPAKSFDISEILNYIGLIHKTDSKYQEAIDYYTQASQIQNADVTQKIIAYEGIARTYSRLDDINKTTEYYNHAIKISVDSYGVENERSVKIINELEAFIKKTT